MSGRGTRTSEKRFAAYLEGLASVIGHADRKAPLRDYCVGLMACGGRKSVEPMAAVTAPERTAAQHQSLLHFVGSGAWSDEKVLSKVREMVLPAIERQGPIEGWIIDDTGFPKQGRHSVGVARQYCGQLGKQDNCQVAVSLSIANHHASLPVAYCLYLPKEWTEDCDRRRKVGIPAEVGFRTKPEIALEQLRWACASNLPRGVVLMDAGYGNNSDLRTEITALGLTYVAGLLSSTTVWAPGTGPLPPKPWSGRGRPPKLMRRNRQHQPAAVKALAIGLPAQAWRTITWRQGTNEELTSRFARVRVRAAHRDYWQTTRRLEEWLLIEWPKGEDEPTKYWLSTMPEDVAFRTLVETAKLRWRIERDYQDLKQEVGLGHFQGRGWRGFHHHATMCIVAYGFLISERETIPPSGARRAQPIPLARLPADYRPRGSAAADPTSHSKLDRDDATAARAWARPNAVEMSLLCDQVRPLHRSSFVTQ
ncbi:SRSO17 transposase [Bradyrhizobium sp. USDA 4524]|uniref:IS701 family transposase n=1 Tax=unclassified Bradyrhizobium TaxID=2631580 RepID=UPI00209D50AB|nr:MULTISPECIES: IS701 family transposase [unclassified Bradyrhizobium]MCP1845746.1 SRSO17 transposase [Bradyrhizobium sp. USDA 4538]MCP1846102.1 SRSO17 transposase [Bradyrhizobium sp. USDA 4538]MCP1906931.1 SRSO17 transposase [Bradyrhizobium sp. USDA 4537]MCP1907264.1 SRSO17 transposase [Bradyrhizobium sp. USDA 4537]MCP1985406.1 SRSO17 transposase [Bradyrhizobium sp. USDA 4539]